MKQLLVFIFAIILLGCEAPQARRPLNSPKNTFLKNSASRNKLRFAQEQSLFKKVAEQNPELNFKVSEKGFWYALQESETSKGNFPRPGDAVQLRYQIEHLNGALIYNEETLGEVQFLVDKEDVIPALREGVKVLKVGQKGVFLFPSFMCYGVQGDFEKIGSNQPLRFIITLVALKSEN
jgi:gliding motility-associated peptidyl-prolyl isomerase